MTCAHRTSRVVNSRPHDFINSSGNPMFRNHTFTFMIGRRRECEGCGERFNTFEMTESQVAQFQRHNAAAYAEVKAKVEALALAVELLQPEFPEAA